MPCTQETQTSTTAILNPYIRNCLNLYQIDFQFDTQYKALTLTKGQALLCTNLPRFRRPSPRRSGETHRSLDPRHLPPREEEEEPQSSLLILDTTPLYDQEAALTALPTQESYDSEGGLLITTEKQEPGNIKQPPDDKTQELSKTDSLTHYHQHVRKNQRLNYQNSVTLPNLQNNQNQSQTHYHLSPYLLHQNPLIIYLE